MQKRASLAYDEKKSKPSRPTCAALVWDPLPFLGSLLLLLLLHVFFPALLSPFAFDKLLELPVFHEFFDGSALQEKRLLAFGNFCALPLAPLRQRPVCHGRALVLPLHLFQPVRSLLEDLHLGVSRGRLSPPSPSLFFFDGVLHGFKLSRAFFVEELHHLRLRFLGATATAATFRRVPEPRIHGLLLLYLDHFAVPPDSPLCRHLHGCVFSLAPFRLISLFRCCGFSPIAASIIPTFLPCCNDWFMPPLTRLGAIATIHF
mmetsp:Transcript_24311/g.44318  ORF Transcript_24311/g.44318 Transcript_24311/m.44318 type:complete len:260 (+) Transcript_24311:96-875(+)